VTDTISVWGLRRKWKGNAMKAMTEREVTREAIWMTPRQAADYLGVGVDTIYDACAAGGLKHVKLGYRTIRVRREWIDRWTEGRAREFA
jgi:excisionase family DNA binding protein